MSFRTRNMATASLLAGLIVGCWIGFKVLPTLSFFRSDPSTAEESAVAQGGLTMSTHENKALVRLYYEELTQRHLDAMFALLSADYVLRLGPGVSLNRTQLRQAAENWLKAFPDLNVTIEDMVAEGDHVVSRLVWRGTHRGEWEYGVFGPVQPTGATFEAIAVNTVRVAGGHIIEEWELFDYLALARQLGELAPPRERPHD